MRRGYYLDWDEDGYGTPNVRTESCEPPDGYVLNRDDCHDRDPATHPDAAEVCDGTDNDCSGQVDETPGDVTFRLEGSVHHIRLEPTVHSVSVLLSKGFGICRALPPGDTNGDGAVDGEDDADRDGIPNGEDFCDGTPTRSGENVDSDRDGIGDACDLRTDVLSRVSGSSEWTREEDGYDWIVQYAPAGSSRECPDAANEDAWEEEKSSCTGTHRKQNAP